MCLYRTTRDRQAKTCALAFRLGGKERLPDLCKNGWGNTRSRVGQVDVVASYSAFRLDTSDARDYGPALRHGITGVRPQGQKNLAPLLAIRLNFLQFLRRGSDDFH